MLSLFNMCGFSFLFLRGGGTSQTHKIWPFSANLKCGLSLNQQIYFTFVCTVLNTRTRRLKYYTVLSVSDPYIYKKITKEGHHVKPFQRRGSSAVLKRLIETSSMQIKALLFISTWRPVTHWNHCVSMQWDNTPDYKWCFVVYYRRHALLHLPQPLAIRPGSISAAGQKNSPRQMTTVDHNGAAEAKRPHQDAALMPFWRRGETERERPDLGEEPADPRTSTCTPYPES